MLVDIRYQTAVPLLFEGLANLYRARAHLLKRFLHEPDKCLVYLNREFLYRDIGYVCTNLNCRTIDTVAGRLYLGTSLNFLDVSTARRASRMSDPS